MSAQACARGSLPFHANVQAEVRVPRGDSENPMVAWSDGRQASSNRSQEPKLQSNPKSEEVRDLVQNP